MYSNSSRRWWNSDVMDHSFSLSFSHVRFIWKKTYRGILLITKTTKRAWILLIRDRNASWLSWMNSVQAVSTIVLLVALSAQWWCFTTGQTDIPHTQKREMSNFPKTERYLRVRMNSKGSLSNSIRIGNNEEETKTRDNVCVSCMVESLIRWAAIPLLTHVLRLLRCWQWHCIGATAALNVCW